MDTRTNLTDPAPDLNLDPLSGAPVEDRIRAVGRELKETLAAVLAALPGAPHRPNQLALLLKCNRAVASKLLSGTAKTDPMEVVHLVPGPEPLRQLIRVAIREELPTEMIAAATVATDHFDVLIRDYAGTRTALDSLISSTLPGARERMELSGKYSVYKGLSQLKGARADLWLGAAIIAPSDENSEKHDLTWINGATSMQRLRRGVTVRFSYRHLGPEKDEKAGETELYSEELTGVGVTSLDKFCVNPPARLEASRVGQTLQYTLPDDLLGAKQAVDMFVVDHHPAAMNRYSKPGSRKRNSLFIEPAMPVANLLFDTILHEDAFPGSAPELYVYDTGYNGIANVNDAERDIDRVDLMESIEFLGSDMRRFRAAELPNYEKMLLQLSGRFGWDPTRFRAYRVRIQYPVYGWQVSMSFDPPLQEKPAGIGE